MKVQNVNWYGFEVRNSNNVVIENCSTFMSGASGIYANTCSTIEVVGNNIQKACQVSTREASGNGTQECITFGAVDRFKISRNEVSNSTIGEKAGGEGIDVKGGTSNGEISNNYVHDIVPLGIYLDAGSFGSGLSCFNGAKSAMSSIRVFGNTIERTNGIAVAGELGGHSKDIFVYNNVIKESLKIGFVFNIPGADLVCNGTTISKAQVGRYTNIYIVNNVFYNNKLADIVSNSKNPNNSNIIIKNNIFYTKDVYNTTFVRSFRFDDVTPFTVKNNMYYDFKPSVQSITLDAKDINLLDPLFVDAKNDNFSVASNSPAINKAELIYLPGTTQLMFTTDINGKQRGTSNWDMGVSEFASVTGVVLSPSNSSIKKGGTLQLSATINPSDASNKNVSWTSSNASIATVSTNGLVTASSTNTGSVNITVTTQDGGFTATAVVSVTAQNNNGTNIVKNGAFDSNTLNWELSLSNGAKATISAANSVDYSGNSLNTTITNATTNVYAVQIRQAVPLTAGKQYKISFRASAASNRTIVVALQQNVSPFATWFNQTVSLSTTPTSFGPFVFDCVTSDPSNMFKLLLGGNTAKVIVDDIVIEEINSNTSKISNSKEILNTNSLDNDLNDCTKITLYPNPVVSTVNVNTYAAKINEVSSVSIFNYFGLKVYSKEFYSKNEGDTNFEINLSFLSDGVYIVRISTKTCNRTIRIMKKT